VELYAIQKSYAVSYLEKIENATLDEHSAAHVAFGDDTPASIVARSATGNEATIAITGLLSPTGPSPLARFFGFGGTGYNEIIAAADELRNDASIDTVRLIMDTPGGAVSGMDAARQALVGLAAEKTLIAENHGLLASAGYYLATAAVRIKAMSPLALTGSIGIVVAGIDSSEALARNGLKRIRIVSANAPNKQPDPTTTQGRGVIQDGVDAMERIFINTIAEGRNTTSKDVIDNFGKGGELVAQDPDLGKPDALSVGMIDSVMVQGNEVVAEADIIIDDVEDVSAKVDNTRAPVIPITTEQTAEGGGKPTKETVMDLKELKASHPALYAEAVGNGRKAGIADERMRSEAHIVLGEASGDMKYALECVKDGTELTAVVNSKHMAASINKKSVDDRSNESEDDLDTEGDADAATDSELAKATAAALGVELNDEQEVASHG